MILIKLRSCFLLGILLALIPKFLMAAEVNVVLQQGINGYDGCEDAQIHSHGYYYGRFGGLGVGDSYTGTYYHNVSLIRFKNIAVNLGRTTVVSAQLYLYLGVERASNSRIIRAYRVLQDWDEDYCDQGEKTESWDNYRAGKRWNGSGVSVASDLVSEDGSADRGSTEIGSVIVDKGINRWYVLDVTKAVQRWYTGEWKEYGLVLMGSVEPDSIKEFYDSESANIEFRPKLIIKCNPDLPVAYAGEDQHIGVWGNKAFLDGSGSSDLNQPTSELVFSWRFLSIPPKSNLTDSYISPNNSKGKDGAIKASFVPDISGVYDIELVVTNALGLSDSDQVSVFVGNPHPRIWLTPHHLEKLRNFARRKTSQWTRVKDFVDSGNADIFSICMVYQVTQDPSYADQAIRIMIKDIKSGSGSLSTAAFCFDWAYDRLSKEQRDFLVDYVNGEIEKNNRGILRADFFLWGNRSVFRMLDVGLAGMATYGDNSKAQEWIDGAYKRFKELTAVEMEIAGEGGGYPEGTVYGAITVMRILQYVEAILTYSGEDLYSISPWFYDRMAFELLLDYPGFSRNGNYREYPSFGDSERNRYTIADYTRISRLMLIHHYPDSDTAKYLQWYLNQKPADKVNYRYLMGQEFIWYNPDQPQMEPTLLSHYAKGTGTVLMRSDWKNDAVYVSFQGGDHLAYHQHIDQNSFTIFKEGDLAIESGVYDGDGLSPHDLQYYARSIAHNTMLVYDPNEVWGNFRGGYAALNDGGQRMMTPAPVVISSAESWKKNKHYYDTADITRFYDSKEMTYIFSNATNAYSSSKVTNFTRQLAYLRPNIIIIFDRVSSTNPAFAKKFLVHFLNEPFINGNGIFISPGEYLYDGDLTIASVNNSELLIKTLLPENNRIRKVGGRGVKDYYVFGINYKTDGNEYEKDYGEWRIEIEPTVERKDDIFLNVFYPTKSRENRMPGMAKLDGDNLTGVQIGNNAILFSKSEIELENAEIAITGNGLYGFYVADMVAEKSYNIYVDKKLSGTFSSTDSNLLIFNVPLNGRNIVTISPALPQPGPPGRPVHFDKPR